DALRDIARRRVDVMSDITSRAVAYCVDEAEAVAAGVLAQHEERLRLEAVVDRVYEDAFDELTSELDGGSLIRTEVIERWAERVGTGDVARWIKGSASWLKDVADRLSGQPAAEVGRIEREARRELADAVTVRLERAARAVGTAWEVDDAGRALLTPDLRAAGGDVSDDTEAVIDRWLASLAALVEAEGPRRLRARSEEHTSELQSRENLVCRLLLEKKKCIKKSANVEKRNANILDRKYYRLRLTIN